MNFGLSYTTFFNEDPKINFKGAVTKFAESTDLPSVKITSYLLNHAGAKLSCGFGHTILTRCKKIYTLKPLSFHEIV